jgi:hypothetical protein
VASPHEWFSTLPELIIVVIFYTPSLTYSYLISIILFLHGVASWPIHVGTSVLILFNGDQILKHSFSHGLCTRYKIFHMYYA